MYPLLWDEVKDPDKLDICYTLPAILYSKLKAGKVKKYIFSISTNVYIFTIPNNITFICLEQAFYIGWNLGKLSPLSPTHFQ